MARHRMGSTGPFQTEEVRQSLIAQVAHLVDEMDAFVRHFGLIPHSILEGKPFASTQSFKEMYGLLAAFDEEVYGPALQAVAREEAPEVAIPDEANLLESEPWNERPMDEIVDRVKRGRSRIVEELKKQSDWSVPLTVDGEDTDVFGLAFGIVQHDAALLRAAAHRLHESRLSSREGDLPK